VEGCGLSDGQGLKKLYRNLNNPDSRKHVTVRHSAWSGLSGYPEY